MHAIRDAGKTAVLINNNPKQYPLISTPQTGFTLSLTSEYTTEVLLREQADGILLQFGGQTAINLAEPIKS